MKVKAKINLLGATESGVSKATGNPWMTKEVVLEVAEEGYAPSTIAVKTFNTDVVKALEGCMEGDEIVADIYCRADYREFTRKDGTLGGIRSTDITLRGVDVVKQVAL